jgi:hypothetical protein
MRLDSIIYYWIIVFRYIASQKKKLNVKKNPHITNLINQILKDKIKNKIQ